MNPGNAMVFDAICGKQGKRRFYTTMCSFGTVSKFRVEKPVKSGQKRPLRKSAIPVIAKYLTGKKYIVSSIAVAINRPIQFMPHPDGGRAGQAKVPMEADILVNDGQHRCLAIKEACQKNPELNDEMIPVIMYEDVGFETSDQMYLDFSTHAAPYTKSTRALLGDSRHMPGIMQNVPLFRDMTDTVNTTISNRSTKLFTLSSVSRATDILMGDEKNQKLAESFWNAATRNIPEWGLAVRKKISPYTIRTEYVHGSATVLYGLGHAGNRLIKKPGWKGKLHGLKKIDWSRKNPEWEPVMDGPHISKTRVASKKAAEIISRLMRENS